MLLPVLPELYNSELYGDKIYAKQELAESLEREQNVKLYTPVKLAKGQERLDLIDRVKSENVSRIRQPIESIFNWFIEKTDIQNASKIRSGQGLGPIPVESGLSDGAESLGCRPTPARTSAFSETFVCRTRSKA